MTKKLNNIWDVENNFYLKSHVSRLKKAVCHYEVFKKTLDVPGFIIECGVFKGSSLIRFLTYRDLLKKTNKKVLGFDPFGKFPKQSIKEDNKFAKKHDKSSGLGISEKKLNFFLKKKNFINFKLVKGDIIKTLPVFLKKNKNIKISFLHLDMDVYEPTKFVLNKLFNKVSKNGIILIDDYGQVKGATKATNEFVKKAGKLKILKLNFNNRLRYILKK
ncbi:macrocin O-methyltransferase [Pelagibacteraceae bacterium]|nr:TylF/MycF family methyltransferase [Pelagibacteraceae bacterium]MDC0952868.1 macrocin O-methyltransferase [Pelagibacteraceae bacterium]